MRPPGSSLFQAKAALRAAVALALTTGWAASPALATQEKPARTAKIVVGEPEGFGALTGPQKATVDIYFGDRKLGQAIVTHQPGSLRFDDPDRIIDLLPALSDPAALRAALAVGDLASNAHRACTRGADRQQCGRLAPEVVGVIFDEARFRVDVFLNPRQLQVSQAQRVDYLPRPQSGATVLNALSAVMSGSSQRGQIYNVQNRLMIGDAEKRLRAEVAYSSAFGAQAEQLVAEIDRPGWRFSAGAFWTPGTSITGRRKILGVGAETQFDTRLDKDEMQGNPLIVFLATRSKVDILRDGRVIASRIYEAGNQSLDTSGLPDGAYDVVLRIEEAGGAAREERRFFTRNRQIAPLGQSIYYAYAGVLVDDLSRKFLAPTKTPFAQAGAGWRLSSRVAIDANILATNKVVVAEAGATWISRAAQLRAGGVITSSGTRGGFFRASSTGNSRLNFDFDLRHIRTREIPYPGPPPPDPGDPLYGRNLAMLPIARRTYTQLAGSLNYSLHGGQFGVAAAWRREQGEAATYNVGPYMRYDVLRRGPWQLSFQGDYSFSRGAKGGFAGLSLRFLGSRASFGTDAGLRTRSQSGAPGHSGPVGSIYGSWNRDDPDGTDIELGGAYDRDLDRSLVNGRALVRTTKAQLAGEVIHTLTGAGSGGTQYSLGFQTTFAMRGGEVALVGKNRSDSMVLVGIKGAGKESRFEVLINDTPAGTVRGGGHLALSLSPYRQYDIRIRPADGALLHYDGAARRIGLYPGNVTRLEWPVHRLVAMFGQLTFPGGEPVGAAHIRAEGGIGQSDDRGFFQIEAAEGTELTVSLADGRSCRVQPRASSGGEMFVKLGTMVCNPSFPRAPLTTAMRP